MMGFAGRCRGGGRLSRTDRLLMGWWLFAALTYIVLESPFLFTPDFLSKENPNYFDELCEFLGAASTQISIYC
jgi:cholestenol delta-isomerase